MHRLAITLGCIPSALKQVDHWFISQFQITCSVSIVGNPDEYFTDTRQECIAIELIFFISLHTSFLQVKYYFGGKKVLLHLFSLNLASLA